MLPVSLFVLLGSVLLVCNVLIFCGYYAELKFSSKWKLRKRDFSSCFCGSVPQEVLILMRLVFAVFVFVVLAIKLGADGLTMFYYFSDLNWAMIGIYFIGSIAAQLHAMGSTENGVLPVGYKIVIVIFQCLFVECFIVSLFYWVLLFPSFNSPLTFTGFCIHAMNIFMLGSEFFANRYPFPASNVFYVLFSPIAYGFYGLFVTYWIDKGFIAYDILNLEYWSALTYYFVIIVGSAIFYFIIYGIYQLKKLCGTERKFIPRKMTLDQVLKNEECLYEFTSFLTAVDCKNYLDFYQDTLNFKLVPLKKKSADIITKYILVSSETCINFEYEDDREDIIQRYNSTEDINSAFFDEIFLQTRQSLQTQLVNYQLDPLTKH